MMMRRKKKFFSLKQTKRNEMKKMGKFLLVFQFSFLDSFIIILLLICQEFFSFALLSSRFFCFHHHLSSFCFKFFFWLNFSIIIQFEFDLMIELEKKKHYLYYSFIHFQLFSQLFFFSPMTFIQSDLTFEFFLSILFHSFFKTFPPYSMQTSSTSTSVRVGI